jgi:hypothetical protein
MFTYIDIANIALTKLKMKNVFSFIVPYITALEKVFNLFSKIHKILQRMTYKCIITNNKPY